MKETSSIVSSQSSTIRSLMDSLGDEDSSVDSESHSNDSSSSGSSVDEFTERMNAAQPLHEMDLNDGEKFNYCIEQPNFHQKVLQNEQLPSFSVHGRRTCTRNDIQTQNYDGAKVHNKSNFFRDDKSRDLAYTGMTREHKEKSRMVDPMTVRQKTTFDSAFTSYLDGNQGVASVKSLISSLAGSNNSIPEANHPIPDVCHSVNQEQSENHDPFASLALESFIQTPSSTLEESKMLVLESNHSLDKRKSGKPTTSLKNLFATVHLPRPRLIPFTPIVPISRNHSDSHQNKSSITAISFARNAPKAGYLSKLGTSISEYKRRFFVLKPTTFLYYFLSPNDTEPRGCIDLEGLIQDSDVSPTGIKEGKRNCGLQIRELGCLADGQFRFEIILPSQDENDDIDQNRIISLEARNEEVGKEWIRSLTGERLSYCKSQIQRLQQENMELKRQVEDFRLVERDRDGAIQDAKEWKSRYNELDKALVPLKQYVSRPPQIENRQDEIFDYIKDKKSQRNDVEKNADDNKVSDNDRANSSTLISISENKEKLESIKLPGTNFASLSNACMGLHEVLRLTSIEANTSVEDLIKANQNIKALQDKVSETDKNICKLWEGNCELRDNLKQIKKEKKILIKEIRSLRESKRQNNEEMESKKYSLRGVTSIVNNAVDISEDAMLKCNPKDSHTIDRFYKVANKPQLATPEKRLLFELEEHVESSIRQHEQFLESNELNQTVIPKKSKKVEGTAILGDKSIVQEMSSSALEAKVSNMDPIEKGSKQYLPHKAYEPSDHSSTSDQSSESGSANDVLNRTFSPLRPKQLCLMDQLAVDDGICDEDSEITSDSIQSQEPVLSCDIPHQFVKDGSPVTVAGHGTTSSQTDTSLKSTVTGNCSPTSKLVCPLNDVNFSNAGNQVAQVYHLTFYSSKIGLQFQKVPCDRSSIGILTDALTADIIDEGSECATKASRTAEELHRISSIRNQNDPRRASTSAQDNLCPVILPADIVLVCGFCGFDGNSCNTKPSLGARLVAFDGISVERGPWTFDTVSKAIKARGRPLTLTFRDDHLNTNQRSILTKAASEVEALSTIPRPTVHYRSKEISLHKTRSQLNNPVPKSPPREWLRRRNYPKAATTALQYSVRHSHSDPDYKDVGIKVADSESNCSHSENWKSFSDSGTSSIFSTKFSPFLSGLMLGLSKNEHRENDNFTPSFCRRAKEPLDCIPHHQEFKANLL